MTKLQDAFNEGQAAAVIKLVETGIIGTDPAKSFRENVANILAVLPWNQSKIDYWINFYQI